MDIDPDELQKQCDSDPAYPAFLRECNRRLVDFANKKGKHVGDVLKYMNDPLGKNGPWPDWMLGD